MRVPAICLNFCCVCRSFTPGCQPQDAFLKGDVDAGGVMSMTTPTRPPLNRGRAPNIWENEVFPIFHKGWNSFQIGEVFTHFRELQLVVGEVFYHYLKSLSMDARISAKHDSVTREYGKSILNIYRGFRFREVRERQCWTPCASLLSTTKQTYLEWIKAQNQVEFQILSSDGYVTAVNGL